ncbi:MAG: type IV pilus assembly protein PilB, partial [Candidatus Berkelbacteria bacterium Licking1014_85]
MPDISSQILGIQRQQEEELTKTVGRNLGINYIDLIHYQIPADVLQVFSEEEAKKYRVIAYSRVGNTVNYATINVMSEDQKIFVNSRAIEKKLIFKKNICSQTSFNYCLAMYQKIKTDKAAKVEKARIDKLKDWANIVKTLDDITSQIAKVSTTELVDLVLAGAINLNASDVHIESTTLGSRLRYRIDGVLQDVAELKKEQYKALLNRIKNTAKLKLDLSNMPQDGRFE